MRLHNRAGQFSFFFDWDCRVGRGHIIERAPRDNDPGRGPTQDGLARHHLIYFRRLKSIGLDRMITQSGMKEQDRV